MRRLQLSRAVVIGAALTKYDTKVPGYGYGYSYGYGYGHKSYDYGAQGAPRGLSVRDSNGGEQQPQLTHTT